MTAGEPADAPPAETPLLRRRPFLRDWRVWLGFAVTTLALWWTLRDVQPGELLASLSSAEPVWIALMIPCHWLGLWFRAVRWRHLTAPISEEPLPLGPLYRATAIGFMAVNIFPLRIGELMRPWVLARETGVRGSAALGTLVLERAIDFTMLAGIGAVVLSAHRHALPAWVRTGAIVFAGIALIPFVLAVSLRRDEERTLRFLTRMAQHLPARASERAVDVLTELCRGLGALQGARSVSWVLFYSALLWGGLFAAPFGLGLLAFHLELTPGAAILATYTALVFTALAIAAPSAPGFVGVYHFACREALDLFGISSATAVAYGTALHLAFWFPVTAFGLLASLRSGARVADLALPRVGKARPRAHR